MTTQIDTILHQFRKAEEALATEAKKVLPAFLEMEDISYGRFRENPDYKALADKCWFQGIDTDNEITFESDNDYHYLPLEFIKDPQGHLEAARRKAAQKEAERKDRNLRLRNERIREAQETLRREGVDFLIIEN